MRPFHHLGATLAGGPLSKSPRGRRPLRHLTLLLILLAFTTIAASQERFLTRQRIDQLELRRADSESASASIVEHLEKLYSQLRASRSEGEQLRQQAMELSKTEAEIQRRMQFVRKAKTMLEDLHELLLVIPKSGVDETVKVLQRISTYAEFFKQSI